MIRWSVPSFSYLSPLLSTELESDQVRVFSFLEEEKGRNVLILTVALIRVSMFAVPRSVCPFTQNIHVCKPFRLVGTI